MHSLTPHGVRMPALGFGTWRIFGDACAEAVADALAIGYRHVDTAAVYDNEDAVGQGLRASGVPRADVFLTTKVWHDQLAPDALRASAEASLRRLGTDYVDLLLVHWPTPDLDLAATLGALDGLRADGKTRLVGVSNFPPRLFAEALRLAPVACNQVEYHPFLDQHRLLDLARAHDAVLTAYRPLDKGNVDGSDVLRAIAEAHGRTPAQVALRWLVQQPGVAAIPKAASPANRRANLAVFEFALTDDEMARITALTAQNRRAVDPGWGPDWENG